MTAKQPEHGSAATARGRPAIAASILVVLLVGAYFAASRGRLGTPTLSFLIQAAVVAIAFWFPATRLASPGALLSRWKELVIWLLAWTLVWDLAVSGIVGTRALFEDWWIVYPAGVAILFLLLLLHTAIVRRVGAGPPAA